MRANLVVSRAGLSVATHLHRRFPCHLVNGLQPGRTAQQLDVELGVLGRLVHEVVGRLADWLGELVEERFDEAGGCRGADSQ